MAESTTENIFRDFYGPTTFIEKHDIPKKFGFVSKKATGGDVTLTPGDGAFSTIHPPAPDAQPQMKENTVDCST